MDDNWIWRNMDKGADIELGTGKPMAPAPAPGFCTRCGDKLHREDSEDVLVWISYRGLSDGIRHDLTLCKPCQKVLQTELYLRGLTA